jgi:hypothetical protein
VENDFIGKAAHRQGTRQAEHQVQSLNPDRYLEHESRTFGLVLHGVFDRQHESDTFHAESHNPKK